MLKTTLSLTLFCLCALVMPGQQSITNLVIPGSQSMGTADYAWYEPLELGKGVQFEKIEVGISLPISERGAIINYLRKLKVGAKLNPFDPNDVDVRAHFWYKENEEWIHESDVFGFFFRDFERDTRNADVNRHRWKNVPNSHDFRVRFAPRNVGSYRCQIEIFIKGNKQFDSGVFAFNVAGGSNPGFVEVADNKQYLTVGDELFFPTGVNMVCPRCKDDLWKNVYCEGVTNESPYGIDGWNAGTTMHPLAYEAYIEELKVAAEGGANYFRMVNYPWALDIEFEELNNYNKRMHIAWEIDSIVNTAEQLGMRFTLVQANRAFAWLASHYYFAWDWQENLDPCREKKGTASCYNQPELGIVNPLDFLTAPAAKDAYKKKLRYMFSRWGYSTSWTMHTLMSEINGFGGGHAAEQYRECDLSEYERKSTYKENESIQHDVYKWHKEMSEFIKDSLQNTNQLLGINYVLMSNYRDADSSIFLNSIDVTEYNHFVGSKVERYLHMTELVDRYQSAMIAEGSPKPVLVGETRAEFEGVKDNCDNEVGWTRTIFLSAFTGAAGSALSWDDMHNLDVWREGYCGKMMKLVESDLHLRNWEMQSARRNDIAADLMTVVDENKEKAWAILSNNTWNFYTMRSCDGCFCDDEGTGKDRPGWDGLPKLVQELEDVSSGYFGNRLSIKQMEPKTEYVVTYYEAFSGKEVQSGIARSNRKGDIKLSHPVLKVEDKDNQEPFLVIRVTKPAAEILR